MKNIHVLPTNQKSKIFFNHNKGFEKYQFSKEPFVNGLTNTSNQNIYITNDEEIKEGDYFYSPFQGEERILKYNKFVIPFPKDKKIILTTDQDLIKDGVQEIDDEFLEWFVKNPSCEFVDVYNDKSVGYEYDHYSIIIPKEELKQSTKDGILSETPELVKQKVRETANKLVEPKQETTLEEVAEKYVDSFEYGIAHPRRVCKNAFINGAKWQQENSYSEEDLEYAFEQGKLNSNICYRRTFRNVLEILQFKKK